MKFISKILNTYQKGLEYDSLKDKNDNLRSIIKELREGLQDVENKLERQQEMERELYEQIAELEEENKIINKHSSIENYKKFLNSIPAKAKYYDFGKGRRRVHTVFQHSLQDEDIIREFINDILQFNAEHDDTADDLVFHFLRIFNNKLPTKRYYDSDIAIYGKKDYWASAKETIERYKANKRKLFDCDDVMVLVYSCLYYLLQDKFPEEQWRLRGFIVDLWGNLGGHALLGWVKNDDVNDFVPIETTFMDNKQGFMWTQNYRIRNQLFYQIRYSFDNEEEYVRI